MEVSVALLLPKCKSDKCSRLIIAMFFCLLSPEFYNVSHILLLYKNFQQLAREERVPKIMYNKLRKMKTA